MRKEAGEPESDDDDDEEAQQQQRAEAAAAASAGGGRAGRKAGDMYFFSLRSQFSTMSSVYALAWSGDVLVTASSTQVRRCALVLIAALQSSRTVSLALAARWLLLLGRRARPRPSLRRGPRRHPDKLVTAPLLKGSLYG